MTPSTLSRLLSTLPFSVAKFARYCDIPTDTLRDVLNGRRAKRGMSATVSRKVTDGLNRLRDELNRPV